MFDIDFYRQFSTLTYTGDVFSALESIRNPDPVVYNIETTNACNMKCQMCPRTTMMTRPVETMKPDLFEKIIDQIEPFTEQQWDMWRQFVYARYKIAPFEMNENHFFLYVIPQVIQLHGYGDPLLDKNMATYVKMLSERGLKSYFSCNPANINVEKVGEMMANGLDYIKFSIESVDDNEHKQIRGSASNFTESYKKILELLNIKRDFRHGTVIVITMLDLNRKNQAQGYLELNRMFADKDVYIYLKSEDTLWYRKVYHPTKSIHWSEPCKHPWMSMTIKSNGEAAMCMEDYNNEIVLGNAKTESLKDIWNGEKYVDFRKQHIKNTKGIRCSDYCEMGTIGKFI